jgi:hypothetical protein
MPEISARSAQDIEDSGVFMGIFCLFDVSSTMLSLLVVIV